MLPCSCSPWEVGGIAPWGSSWNSHLPMAVRALNAYKSDATFKRKARACASAITQCHMQTSLLGYHDPWWQAKLTVYFHQQSSHNEWCIELKEANSSIFMANSSHTKDTLPQCNGSSRLSYWCDILCITFLLRQRSEKVLNMGNR